MKLTEKEKAVFEEYRKEKAELEKNDKARYEQLREAIKNIIDRLSPELQLVLVAAFKLVDKPSGNKAEEDDLRFELTLERLHQVEAKALRRLRHRRDFLTRMFF